MSDDIDTLVAAVKAADTDGPVFPKAIGQVFRVYSVGICCCSVCTNLSDSDAEVRVNIEYPTGITTPWKISEDKTFSGGEPHPSPCPDDSSCRHILFEC
jgi:hypothetical protein